METTANGMNYAYELWHDDDQTFRKVFLPWTDDPLCVAKRAVKRYPVVAEAAEPYDLTPQQLNWWMNVFKTKCGGSLRTLFQEFPITPSMAFVSTGGRFFHCVFQDSGKPEEGYIEFEKPQPFRVYVIGIDTASGQEDGDYSAFVVIDATVQTELKTVASYYGRLKERPFAKMVLRECRKWKALAVPERNTHGVVIVEELREGLWPYIYHDLDKTDDEGVWTRKYGLQTTVKTRPLMLSKLYEALFEAWFDARDQRFRLEANKFAYNTSGKPEALPGNHDDMVMATALAVYGSAQKQMVADEVMSERPRGLREVLAYEKRTGKRYKREDFENSNGDIFGEEDFGMETLFAS